MCKKHLINTVLKSLLFLYQNSLNDFLLYTKQRQKQYNFILEIRHIMNKI